MPAPTTPERPARAVVLASGSGTTLQALLDAQHARDPEFAARFPDGYPLEIVAVGTDVDGCEALARAQRDGIPTFVEPLQAQPNRATWNRELASRVASYEPDMVILAGFMRLVSQDFLDTFPDRVFNTHPALSPSFPGTRGPADALRYGVTITGATLFIVDAGCDTGAIVAQTSVPVMPDDDVATLHDRIKSVERVMLVHSLAALATGGWTIHSTPTRRKVTIP